MNGNRNARPRVLLDDLRAEFARVLRAVGFADDRADASARLFAEATLDGVHSHGLHKFPKHVASVRAGHVLPGVRPDRVHAFGATERWDGRLGPGNLNAADATDRAVALAREHGIGLVALANTNHWMRGGSYGWRAADAGAILLAWSNTMPNLPAWGGTDPRLGNDPLVVAVPRADGRHVVLDTAMSQFSYGQLEAHRLAGRELPVDGGYDDAGRLTRDPDAILTSRRPLPIGFWKGSGLSLVLDLLAAGLSGGKAVHEITEEESGLSQMFVAIDPERFGGADPSGLAERVVADLHDSEPVVPGEAPTYPGERTWRTRQDGLAHGVPVDPDAWERVRALTREA